MQFRIFESGGMLSTPSQLLQDASKQAAGFLKLIPRNQVVAISQGFAQQNMAYVTVWYEPHSSDSSTRKQDKKTDESEIQD